LAAFIDANIPLLFVTAAHDYATDLLEKAILRDKLYASFSPFK
jgi:hypothetical protein